jgi:cytidylate kinase
MNTAAALTGRQRRLLMSDKILVPSIEKRMASLIELGRRNLTGYSVTDTAQSFPTITISREFGCEAFPVTARLKELFEAKSKVAWQVMDKALLEEIGKNNQLSEGILNSLGEGKNRFLDDMISTFSPRWKSDKDHYKLLCKQITALATSGNCILVGRGSAILTQDMGNCFQFRIVAPQEFKVRSISKRLNISADEAEKLIAKKQKQRDDFIKDFLNRDVKDINLYHLVFNNGKNSAAKIAETIFHYVTAK